MKRQRKKGRGDREGEEQSHQIVKPVKVDEAVSLACFNITYEENHEVSKLVSG